MEKEKLLKKWRQSGVIVNVHNECDELILAECCEKIDKLLKYKRNKLDLQSGLYGVIMYAYHENRLLNNCLIDYDKLIHSFIEDYKINGKPKTRKESSNYCKNFVLNFLKCQNTITVHDILNTVDMSDFEKRLENPTEYDEIVKQHNLNIKTDELAQNIIHKIYNKQFSNQDKKYIVFIYEEDENLKHTDILCIDINEPFEIPNIKNAIAVIHSTFLENYEFTVFDENLSENFLYPYKFRIYITGIDKYGKLNSIHKDF